MAMVHCQGCGKEIHASAQTCPLCGAPQAPAKGGERAAISSYDQVPWFRKNWFAIVSWLIFSPAFIVVALTGDIYYQKKGELKTYGKMTKIVFSILGVLYIAKAILGK